MVFLGHVLMIAPPVRRADLVAEKEAPAVWVVDYRGERPRGRQQTTMKYGIYTRHTAKPGQRDNLVAILLGAADLLRDNHDCLHWVVNTTDEPDIVWVNVVWTSKEAHDASLQPENVRALIGEAKQFLSEDVMPQQIFRTPVGGKGL